MKEAGVKIPALATALGVSYQAVKKMTTGASSGFTAINNEKAANFLKVSPKWLATGKGPMREPKASVTPAPAPVALIPPEPGIHYIARLLVDKLSTLDETDRKMAAIVLEALATRPDDASKNIERLAKLLGEIDTEMDTQRRQVQ
ncbi:hypothetical protein RD110_15755 [Rhodoferax koreense]|uniref:HTH cro/C1-type domain-containing protein n=2 Tax=Rhodoferax koreensis TaxID=1842727 RepID=A0A1P8JXJ8_9BURK|nr:hypothetical protein RD110_15755 [Rhodoferax koreense]